MTASCPHCFAPNSTGSSFCTACGKAVPTSTPGGPRILGANDLASSAAGTSLMLDQLTKQTKKAFGALLAVGIIQTLVAVGFTIVASKQNPSVAIITGVILGGVGVLFLGLAFWARKSPLPAAIVGLVVYVSLLALDGIVAAANGHPEAIAQGILVKLVVIGCLGSAISAASKHKALLRNQAAMRPATPQHYSQAA